MTPKIKALVLLIALLALAFSGSLAAQDSEKPRVVITTTKGAFTLELYPAQAPGTVENFLQYANEGFYEGTTFHRVISHFMIQGGGLTEDLVTKETRKAIQNEANNGLKNLRGTVAMARTGEPHSATSQFFINVEANPELDHRDTSNSRNWGYTVFGHVVDGMDVVDSIRFVQTGPGDVPVVPVVITSVEVL